MKVNNRTVLGPKIEVLVIPRNSTMVEVDGKMIPQTDDFVFRARAVLDFSEFDKMCPHPKAPLSKDSRTGVEYRNVEHPEHQKATQEWANRRVNWMLLKSLQATEGLEWDLVKLSDPETWKNWKQDLAGAGFNAVEIGAIENLAVTVNSLSSDKVDEARQRFLASVLEAAVASPSPNGELVSTNSGEAANN